MGVHDGFVAPWFNATLLAYLLLKTGYLYSRFFYLKLTHYKVHGMFEVLLINSDNRDAAL